MKFFEEPKLNVLMLTVEDIITTSGITSGDELPPSEEEGM